MKIDKLPVPVPLYDADAMVSAKIVGLRYVSDEQRGIVRIPGRDGFRYLDLDGEPVDDEATLARIKSLAIPPAWSDVWICRWENGHLQATGRDARKRKQYRYHPRWRTVRDEVKYGRMLSFGRALPLIRTRVDEALKLPGLPREKMLATVVYLLQATMMRIGNEEYARQNRSFGLTTLRNRHVRIDGSEVEFQFRGKSGVRHSVTLHDRRLAHIIQRSRDLPGQELFQYVDDDGQRQVVDSADVNDYLHEITGEDYTAKDFRTWAGTVLAALALLEFQEFDSEAQARKNIAKAIEAVAARLGNTPPVCRKCYIHPAVIDTYLEGAILQALPEPNLKEAAQATDLHALSAEEAAVLALLEQRLQAAAGKPKPCTRERRSNGKNIAEQAERPPA